MQQVSKPIRSEVSHDAQLCVWVSVCMFLCTQSAGCREDDLQRWRSGDHHESGECSGTVATVTSHGLPVLLWSSGPLDTSAAVPLAPPSRTLLDTGRRRWSRVAQGWELHLLSASPPAASPPDASRSHELELLLHCCSTHSVLLQSFTRPQGSDFLLLIRPSIWAPSSSSSSPPQGSLLLLLVHRSFSFHFLSIRLLRRFIAMTTSCR